jgi:peptidoglycan hydrolase CwlO-like protein
MPRYKMNEVKINTGIPNIIGILAAILLIAIICTAVIYYYRGASGKLESELDNIENINAELASETRQLQAGIASHGAGIKTVRTSLSKSRERIEHVYSDLEKAGSDADRAIEIIDESENIIEAIKTQR